MGVKHSVLPGQKTQHLQSSGIDPPRRDMDAALQFLLSLALLLGMGACFWGLACVCEEFFVPALNLLCEKFNIPDDVAGATLMAAGASSPECFTSLIALFITRSEVGLGTVVGSEIFNHLGICAGSTLYAKRRTLQLAPAIVMRTPRTTEEGGPTGSRASTARP